MDKVTKNTNIGKLTHEHPDTAEVLLSYGLHCVGCMASAFDTIEAGAKVHGMEDSEIEEMILRLNEVVKYGE